MAFALKAVRGSGKVQTGRPTLSFLSSFWRGSGYGLCQFSDGGGNTCLGVYLWKTKCNLINVHRAKLSKMFATMLLIIAEH